MSFKKGDRVVYVYYNRNTGYIDHPKASDFGTVTDPYYSNESVEVEYDDGGPEDAVTFKDFLMLESDYKAKYKSKLALALK